MSQTIKIIGITEEGKNGLPQNYLEWIYQSEILIGGERQLGFFPDYTGQKIAIKNKIYTLMDALGDLTKRTVILASGDPLFFGIGGTIISQLHSANINFEIYPAISSIQLAFARAGVSWHDVKFISVHGRKVSGLAQRVYSASKVALLTDLQNHPAKIAQYLIDFNLSNYRAFVGENLGMKDERHRWFSLQELAEKKQEDFFDLNVLILIRTGHQPEYGYGIPDHEFTFPEKPAGLLTKREIRALSLSSLNLTVSSNVWDIGSCSGSIAIEAARIATEGRVFAIEKEPGHIEHCRANSRKFHADINFIEGVAPEALYNLPDPHAVFVGGSGGRLREILRISSDRLAPGGRIVVNAATIDTLNTAMDFFTDNDFIPEVTMVQISRSRKLGDLTGFQSLNPVFILTAYQNNI